MRTAPDQQTFLAVADQAKRRHLSFTAHPLFPPEVLLRAGLSSVEHFLSWPPLNTLSQIERRALYRRIAKSGMHLSNTMVNIDGLLTPYAKARQLVNDARGTLDPRRKYLCGYLIEDWREQVEEMKDSPYEERRGMLPDLYRNFREMREAGVRFLAGTDAGVVFIYPGFSLHDELDKLVHQVGFTPMEALKIATDGVPSFYRDSANRAAIAPGQAADLVLLDADPLLDIGNTKRIAGVSMRGKWLDRAALDQLLREVEQSAQAGCQSLTK